MRAAHMPPRLATRIGFFAALSWMSALSTP
jgi:hypothetical protein